MICGQLLLNRQVISRVIGIMADWDIMKTSRMFLPTFFIQYLRKGTYVLEYPVVVTQKGIFSNGIATIQSYYAPEFAAHSEGLKVIVD